MIQHQGSFLMVHEVATMGNTNPRTREEHASFIYDHWDTLAAAAWNGFQEVGRGAMVIATDPADEKPKAGYVGMKALQLTFPLKLKMTVMLKSYEPQRGIVVIITRQDGGFSMYQCAIANGLTPPKAAKAKESGDVRES